MTKIPKMTRAHFQYLAGLLNEIQPDHTLYPVEHDQWEHTVRAMGIALTWTNDSFNKGKFYDACGGIPT
jgi:hypothetical protein